MASTSEQPEPPICWGGFSAGLLTLIVAPTAGSLEARAIAKAKIATKPDRREARQLGIHTHENAFMLLVSLRRAKSFNKVRKNSEPSEKPSLPTEEASQQIPKRGTESA